MSRTILITCLMILTISLVEPIREAAFYGYHCLATQVQRPAGAFGDFTRSLTQENSAHDEFSIDRIWSATSSTFQDVITALRASFDEVKAAFETMNVQLKELAETLAGI